MSIVIELDLNNQKEVYSFGKVAKQANGSALVQIGKCVVLATVVSEFDNPVGEDFTPLTVQYVEKTYAAAKMPGGFVKRESKPSDFETLTARVVDRSLRPLFPKGYVYPTTITIMVLSADKDVDLQTIALNAASAALYVSDLPIKKSVCGVRIGKVDGELVVNPKPSQMRDSTIDLYVAGTKDELLMIEMKAIATEEMVEVDIEAFTKIHKMNDITEDDLIEAIGLASNAIAISTNSYKLGFDGIQKSAKQIELKEFKINEEIIDFIKERYYKEIKNAVTKLAKSERAVELKDVAKLVLQNQFVIENGWLYSDVYEAVSIIKKELVRDMILNESKRADGRGLKEIRPILIETNILPSAHSSCLFTRGETQALVVSTLSGTRDGQMYELLNEKGSFNENFMVHYNFPGFSVGEAKPMFAPGRRELGHGNLAKKALEASIDFSFTETVRLVSEILESNGSSSMATVCGGSLALKAAGVPIASLVAGVAMGMVTEGDKYAILTDIMGLEDHDGDMDFKVAGTKDGITALQMDIKLGGIELSVLKEALVQAKEARIFILDKMEIAANEIIPSEALPLVEQFIIDPSKIVTIIGKAGQTIKEIIEKFGVSIDLDKTSGNVKVSGESKTSINDAIAHIKTITSNAHSSYPKKEYAPVDFDKVYKQDEIFNGKITKVADFGVFVSLPKGGEGLLHISKISKDRNVNLNNLYTSGQDLKLVILSVKKERIELGLADTLE